MYRKVPKFSDTRKLCCNLPKIQTKRQNLLICQLKDANGIANSEDPDQDHYGKHNQRTNGHVNAHLISWPSKAQNIQFGKYLVKK